MQLQVQAAFLAAAAKEDVGVHTLIQHTDMRTFWKKYFNNLPKVIWKCTWDEKGKAAELLWLNNVLTLNELTKGAEGCLHSKDSAM